MRIVTIAVAAIATMLALVAKRASGGGSSGGTGTGGKHDRLLAIEEAARQKPGKVSPPKMPKISRASD